MLWHGLKAPANRAMTIAANHAFQRLEPAVSHRLNRTGHHNRAVCRRCSCPSSASVRGGRRDAPKRLATKGKRVHNRRIICRTTRGSADITRQAERSLFSFSSARLRTSRKSSRPSRRLSRKPHQPQARTHKRCITLRKAQKKRQPR